MDRRGRATRPPREPGGVRLTSLAPFGTTSQQVEHRPTGLTSAEADRRARAGGINVSNARSDRTLGQIIRSNVVTRFNAILGLLFVVIVGLGPAVDGLFGIILVANMAIGIVQEVRAKRTLDHLTLLTAATVCVIRDGAEIDVAATAVVVGDAVRLLPGAQIVVDGPLVAGDGVEVDESLLTGETEPQHKHVGDDLRSGSFVTSGSGWQTATGVGRESFANRLSDEARRFTPVDSELQAATNTVLRVVTWAIGPIAAALFVGQRLGGESWRSAVFGSATGVLEMVPEGFVLLTSMTMAMSVVRLGRSGVLVKELAAVEGLARVDTVCFDKTGTLTVGRPVVDDIVPLGETPAPIVDAVLAAMTVDGSNGTAAALQGVDRIRSTAPTPGTMVAFTSARKWSALVPSAPSVEAPCWILGAPEVVLAESTPSNRLARDDAARRANRGRRVLALASTANPPAEGALPSGLEPRALITLSEHVRPNAAATLRYFSEQGVEVKILSGDSPITVSAIASAAGLDGLEDDGATVDARSLTDDGAIDETIGAARVVGRCTPEQKRVMVQALQAQRRTVAMTGDGVNDTLALKASDLAIAMGTGSEAARAVAQLVLVNGDFSALPGVVAEGRRVIANVERVGKLFLTKTVYAALLAVATGVARLPFPFLPRQLTLISSLTIGIPGFFLAFAPQAPPTAPGFLRRVGAFAVPAGCAAAAATFAAYSTTLHARHVSIAEARTSATIVLGMVGLWVVGVLARPLTKWREILLAVMGGLGLSAFLVPRLKVAFLFDEPPIVELLATFAIAAATIVLIELGWHLAAPLRHRRDRTPWGRRPGAAERPPQHRQ